MKTEFERKYGDMLHLARPVSGKHPQMSLEDRAAQFSPFAALTGYDAAVTEAARLTEQHRELDESERAALDEALRRAWEKRESEVCITYFKADEKKEGGAYVSATGMVKKIDYYERYVVMTDDLRIYIDDICQIAFV